MVFFDESIDAKMNRYTFKFQILDTPFLNDSYSKHQKTYVAPSPDMNNLPPHEGLYVYENGCSKLNIALFSPPRNLTPPLNSGLSFSSSHFLKLKRLNPHPSSAQEPPPSAIATIYISYIVTISRLVCYTQSHLYEFKSTPRPTIQQLIEEFGFDIEQTEMSAEGGVIGGSGASVISTSGNESNLTTFGGGGNREIDDMTFSSNKTTNHFMQDLENNLYERLRSLDVEETCTNNNTDNNTSNTNTATNANGNNIHGSNVNHTHSFSLIDENAEYKGCELMNQPETNGEHITTNSSLIGLHSQAHNVVLAPGYDMNHSTTTNNNNTTTTNNNNNSGSSGSSNHMHKPIAMYTSSPYRTPPNRSRSNTNLSSSSSGMKDKENNNGDSSLPPEYMNPALSGSVHTKTSSSSNMMSHHNTRDNNKLTTRSTHTGMRSRANTLSRWRNGPPESHKSPNNNNNKGVLIDEKDLLAAAKLGLNITLEAINCLSRRDEPVDDAVYRSVAEACGCCGFAQQ